MRDLMKDSILLKEVKKRKREREKTTKPITMQESNP